MEFTNLYTQLNYYMKGVIKVWTCDVCDREFKNKNQSHSCKSIHTIDEYITLFSSEQQSKLIELREIINKTAPKAKETIRWNMPTFTQNGNLVHFAMQKNHIGFHVGASTVQTFEDELLNYHSSKGTIHLPNDQLLPRELIQAIVRYRVARNTNK